MIINTGLMAHPINWITLALWTAAIGFCLHLAHPALENARANSTANQTGN